MNTPSNNTRRTPSARSTFNLIELMMALVIVAIGVSAVMAMIPAGLEVQRKADGKSSASDASEQLLHYLVSRVNANPNFADALPDTKWTGEDGKLTWSDENLIDVANLLISFKADNATDTFDPAVNQDGVFRVKQVTKGAVADFSAVMRVWIDQSTTDFSVSGTYDPIFDAALYGKDLVKINNLASVAIVGNVLSENTISLNNTPVGTINGNVIAETTYSNASDITVSGTEGTGSVNLPLPDIPAPTSPTDPNWRQPITFVTGDLHIDGTYDFSGTVYVTGKIHVNSGAIITGDGALVSGDQIHFNNIDGSVGSAVNDIFFYSLDSQIHFNNCGDVQINGLIYAPDDAIKLNNVDDLIVTGGMFAGTDLKLNNFGNLTVTASASKISQFAPESFYKAAIDVKTNGYRYVVYVETSWPAELPYDRREKRIEQLTHFRLSRD